MRPMQFFEDAVCTLGIIAVVFITWALPFFK